MSKFCCITDLIRFMMEESKKSIKGSVHEEYFFIAHDSLVLIILKETIAWMKWKNYFHCWLLTMNGLQYGKPYSWLPVGNSPEFMPLVDILNRDILHSFRFYCVLSRFFC